VTRPLVVRLGKEELVKLPQGTLADPLREEHAVLREGLSILQRTADRLGRGEQVSTSAVLELLVLLERFGDHEHLAKEEQALIPALHAAGMPLRYGPLAIVQLEHTKARELGREVGQAARDLPDPAARARFVPLVGELVRLLRAHLEREESQLFSMAAQIVPLERMSAVYEAFDRIERQAKTGGARAVRAQFEDLGAVLAG
jgi:hemerythrin-like domain-containing protein